MLHEKLEPASPVTAVWLLFELGLMHLSDGITGYQLNNILAVHNKTELACLSCGCQSTPEYQHCLYFCLFERKSNTIKTVCVCLKFFYHLHAFAGQVIIAK